MGSPSWSKEDGDGVMLGRTVFHKHVLESPEGLVQIQIAGPQSFSVVASEDKHF